MEKNYWYRSNNLKKYLLAFALLIVGLGIDVSYASDVVYYDDYDLDIIFEENDKENTEDLKEDAGEIDSLEEEEKNDRLNEEISNIISEEMDKVDGSYQVAVKTIEGASSVDLDYRNTSESLPSASTIKLFIAISAYENIERGSINETDSLNNDIHLMLNRSDNSATNRVIDTLEGFSTVNSTIAKLTGSNRTSLNRKLAHSGDENMVDVSDLIMAMEELNNPKLISAINAERIKESMTDTNTKSSKLLANLPPYAKGINKSGENPDRGQELDVAIIDVGSTRFALAVAMKTNKYYDNENELRVLRNMGERITEAFYRFEK